MGNQPTPPLDFAQSGENHDRHLVKLGLAGRRKPSMSGNDLADL